MADTFLDKALRIWSNRLMLDTFVCRTDDGELFIAQADRKLKSNDSILK